MSAKRIWSRSLLFAIVFFAMLFDCNKANAQLSPDSPFTVIRNALKELDEDAKTASRDWITQQCSKEGIDTIPSNHYDAFGHCFYGCESERSLFFGASIAGWIREYWRELEDALGVSSHDSFPQDLTNQRVGVHRRNWEGSCFHICDMAYQNNDLDLTAPERLWRDCDTGRNRDTREEGDRCERCSANHGDPHITTSDGFHYDFQAAGEFIALKSITDDLVIQVRQEPWENSKTVSLNTAAAANVHGDRIAVYGARPEGVQIKVNGRDYSANDSWRKLPKGGTVRNHRGKVITRWLDGTEMWVESFPKHLNVYVKLASERSGQVRGLLGNYNDNPDDELITRDGKQIKLSGKKDELYWVQLYETFGESWRVSEAESLFDYVQGKNYTAFQIKSFPIKSFTIIDLLDDDRKQAQAVCTSSGIRTQPLLDDCVLDVGVTKDAEFARSALAVSNSRYPENIGHSLGAETKSFTVNIDKQGTYPIENFDAQAGQKMFFRALASGELKLSKWELHDPEGKVVFTKSFDPGSMQPGEHVLPKTGNYQSILTTSGSETGALEVTRNLVPDPQIFDISLPIRISPDVPEKGAGRIELPGSKDTFRFTANSGDRLALSVLKKDDRLYLAKWQLRDPKGKLILDRLLLDPLVDDPEARQEKVSIKENGVYTLTVTGGSRGVPSRFDYGHGEYGVFLRFVPR